MAGLVPAIHVFGLLGKDVDARHKAGHDEHKRSAQKTNPGVTAPGFCCAKNFSWQEFSQ
jgi:hypothetical protein